MVELYDLSVTGLPVPSVTGLTVTFFRIHCLVRTQFHGYIRPGHRIFIFIPHLRISHFANYRGFFVLCSGSLRAFFEISLRDLQVRSSPGLKMPSMMVLLSSLYVLSTRNVSLVSIWQQLFPHNHLEQLWELKRLILNKHRRWFHSSRVKCPWVKKVCELIPGVNIPDLKFMV